jgi:trans-aconitate 3-methyltransferase
LSNSFKLVYAADPSSAMLQNAIKKSNINYSISSAENLSQIPSNSVDLVTVAQAAHWFNITEFYKESFRVLKPHGTLAIWCYSYNLFKGYPDARELMESLLFGDDKLGPYWDKGVKLVSNLYRDFEIPEEMFQNVKREIYDGDETPDTEPFLKVEWTISRLTKYFKVKFSFLCTLFTNTTFDLN